VGSFDNVRVGVGGVADDHGWDVLRWSLVVFDSE
jgi:hypothetical protein